MTVDTMLQNRQTTFESRREAKWQFRRSLLLRVEKLMGEQPEQVWAKITANLKRQMESPSDSTRRSTKRWLRFAGKTPQQIKETIQRYFLAETPEGPVRHKLQDLTDGHPFAGVLSDHEIQRLRQNPEA